MAFRVVCAQDVHHAFIVTANTKGMCRSMENKARAKNLYLLLLGVLVLVELQIVGLYIPVTWKFVSTFALITFALAATIGYFVLQERV